MANNNKKYLDCTLVIFFYQYYFNLIATWLKLFCFCFLHYREADRNGLYQ